MEIDPLFYPQLQFDTKNGQLEDLPAVVCKCSPVIEHGYWSVHKKLLDSVFS